jgi:hypothetical protein
MLFCASHAESNSDWSYCERSLATNVMISLPLLARCHSRSIRISLISGFKYLRTEESRKSFSSLMPGQERNRYFGGSRAAKECHFRRIQLASSRRAFCLHQPIGERATRVSECCSVANALKISCDFQSLVCRRSECSEPRLRANITWQQPDSFWDQSHDPLLRASGPHAAQQPRCI